MTIEITIGLVLTIISGIGILGSLIALILTGPIFKKQRRKLLNEIETE